MAEGDSWFQFPALLRDIIDWLKKRKDYAVFSIAYGGDWITNIIYEGTYIGELTVHKPEVFMISGGGNDLVGGNRLGVMVDPNPQTPKWTDTTLGNEVEHREDILAAQAYIRQDFYAFVNTLWVMYTKMFSQLEESGKYDDMLILTQGYDYPFPRWSTKKIWKIWQYFENNIMVQSGRWLKRPLVIRGIPKNMERSILKALIFEINNMFLSIAKRQRNVYHIDSRGVAPKENDWIDELHLRGKKYKEIAVAYQWAIDNRSNLLKKESPQGTYLAKVIEEKRLSVLDL